MHGSVPEHVLCPPLSECFTSDSRKGLSAVVLLHPDELVHCLKQGRRRFSFPWTCVVCPLPTKLVKKGEREEETDADANA